MKAYPLKRSKKTMMIRPIELSDTVHSLTILSERLLAFLSLGLCVQLAAASLPDDPELPRQWNLDNPAVSGLGDIRAAKAWPLESKDSRVVVAVIDTGINYKHPDLIDNIWVNAEEANDGIDNDGNGVVDDFVTFDENGKRKVNLGELVPDGVNDEGNVVSVRINGEPVNIDMADDFFGYDFVLSEEDDLVSGEQPGMDNDPMDRDGENHGTGVAGVIAAVRDNAIQIAGVTSSAEIMPLRSGRRVTQVDPETGETFYALQADPFAQILCIYYAINKGADIIHLSAPGASPYTLLKKAIIDAKNAGILVVCGISNGSNDIDDTTLDAINNADGSPGSDGIPDNASYPASFTFDYDNDGVIDDDNLLVVTATDRLNSLSSFANYGSRSVDIGAPGEFIPTLVSDGTFGYTSGTSVAVAHVTGVAAMLLAKERSLERNLDPVALKYRIMANGDSVATLNSTTVSGGRVNAYKAMIDEATVNQPEWWTEPDTRIIQPGRISDNYAAVTLGQLKHVAKQARDYLEISGNGGAGSVINALVESFETYDANDPTQDPQKFYAPVNLGQLKAVAKPFYDRLESLDYNTKTNLILRGYPRDWPYDTPWDPNTPVEENYSMANLGQLKMVFSFDFSNNRFVDFDGDLIPDRKDADPNNDRIGELSIQITSPLEGSI